MSTNNKFALTVNPSPALVALLLAYQEKWEPRKSLTYIAEECILAGLTAKDRSKQYSEETQNARRFQQVLAEHPEYIMDAAKMQELAKKFRIGASKGGNLASSARSIIAEASAEMDTAAIDEAEAEAKTA